MYVINRVCFTGHRPEKLCKPYQENHLLVSHLKEELLKEIRYAARHGCKEFYSGMARGVDIIAAELVLQLKQEPEFSHIELIAVEPYPQLFARPWQSRKENILKQATHIVLQSEYSTDCYAKRNRYLVDHTQLVIAVWDGGARSGTGQTVEYARKKNKEIHLLRLEQNTLRREVILSPCEQLSF